MGIRLLTPFSTTAFCDTPALYKTNRLWKPIDRRLSADGHDMNVILLLPDELYSEIYNLTISSETEDHTIKIQGISKINFIEPTISTVIPVVIDEELNNLQGLVEKLANNILDLANEFDVEIIITEKPAYLSSNLNNSAFSFFVYMVGLTSHIQLCEPHLVTLLKLIISKKEDKQLFVECLDIKSHSMLPTIVGVDMINIKHMSTTYKSDIYIPSLLTSSKDARYCPQIFFSGSNHALVLQAKFSMSKYLDKANENIFYRRYSSVSPGKLLFIKKFCSEDIVHFMVKYQSFIKVTENYVEFQSCSTALLDIVTKAFTTKILHNIAEIQLTMNDSFVFNDEIIGNNIVLLDDKDIVVMQSEQNKHQLILIGRHGVNEFENEHFNNDSNISKFLSSFFSDSQSSSQIKQIKAVFEIHPDYEDFISGKKNGKLTKIMEITECLLKLEMNETDDIMFLSLISNTYIGFLNSFLQFIDELPAEESFFIPEVYHRPVIGTGGSLIQTIMRKHNVFIQFSNSFLLPQNEFSHIRYDNVIIRCPRKNRMGIKTAKKELNSLAQNYGSMQSRTLIKFTPGQYRHVLAMGTNIISQIEKTKNVYIMFPFEEPKEGYELEIRGNNENSIEAAEELINSTFGLETSLFLSENVTDTNEIYNTIVVPFTRTMSIEVTFDDDMIRLTYHKNNKHVNKALEILEEYLSSIKLEILRKENSFGIIVTNSQQLKQDRGVKEVDLNQVDQYQNYLSTQNKSRENSISQSNKGYMQ